MDQTGSEESKQPAGDRGASSEDSADEQRAGGERPEQEDEPESARRAFDLLERFSGELEEILEALERTRGSGTPAEKSPPPPERAFRPASIHFESSPISTRIDPNALPPVESPGATTRPATRLLLEALFLILVAAISARTGQRPLLIVAAEAVAFVIVFSIELALAREKRRVQRLPAAAPLLTAPEVRTTATGSGVTSVTLDQVEPLVWTDRQGFAEPDWPLGAIELPREAEDTGEAQEGATEISDAVRPEAERVAAREPAPEAPAEADPESSAPTSIVVPEREAAAVPEVEPEIEAESTAEAEGAEPAPARPRRFHFHREAKAPEADLESDTGPEPADGTESEAEPSREIEPEIEPEVETESLPVIEAEEEPEIEAESSAEAEGAEPAPARPRRFHFHREAKAPEADLESETGPEPADGTESEAEPTREIEPEIEAEFEPEIDTDEEPARTSRFLPFRHEAEAPEPEPANEIELPPVTEPEIEAESSLEAITEERERPRRFHRRHRETQAPEAGAELEVEPELVAANPPEIAAEDEAPEQPRRFHRRHREAGEPEEEPVIKLESTVEIPASEEMPERHGLSRLFARDEKLEVEAESPPEAIAEESELEVFAAEAEPEPPRRFHLFRHEERLLDAEMEHGVAAEPEDELRPDTESQPADVAEESESEPPRRFHLFRHEAAASAAAEADDEAPSDRAGVLASVPWPSLPTEPADAAGGGEMEVEIELPPEIAVGEIEHTLEDLGRRTPGLRRRRRRHAGAGAAREGAQPAIEDETAGEDGELRFAAEQERRRREREYLRKLRASR